MGMFLFKIWYIIAVLPLFIFNEGNDMLASFLKKKGIYAHWDSWHAALVILVVLYIVLRLKGYS